MKLKFNFKKLNKHIKSDLKITDKIIDNFKKTLKHSSILSKKTKLIAILTIFITAHSFAHNYKLKQNVSNLLHQTELNGVNLSSKNNLDKLENIFILASNSIENNIHEKDYVNAAEKVSILEKVTNVVGDKVLKKDLNNLYEDIEILEHELDSLPVGIYNYGGKLLVITETSSMDTNFWHAEVDKTLITFIHKKTHIIALNNFKHANLDLFNYFGEKRTLNGFFGKETKHYYKIFVIVSDVSSDEINHNQLIDFLVKIKIK